MAQTYYDVPVVWQGAENPICWVASMAMIESYWTQSSVGVGKYTGGFDPSNSSIPNPASDVVDFQNRMMAFSFYPVYPDNHLTLGYVHYLIRTFGPLLLFHHVNGFPYASGVGTGSGTHAVVITGVDTSYGGFWFNNPWGHKDSWAYESQALPCAVDPSSASYSLYWGYFP